MAQNQNSYDNEFKAQAVKLAQEIGGHKAAERDSAKRYNQNRRKRQRHKIYY